MRSIRTRWSCAVRMAPNSLMMRSSSRASSVSRRQNGAIVECAAFIWPSAACARVSRITPCRVCGVVPPKAAMTVPGSGLSRRSARSLLRRSVSIPGQPGSDSAALAISLLDTSGPPCMAIAQVRICLSTLSAGMRSRSRRASATESPDRASSPVFRRSVFLAGITMSGGRAAAAWGEAATPAAIAAAGSRAASSVGSFRRWGRREAHGVGIVILPAGYQAGTDRETPSSLPRRIIPAGLWCGASVSDKSRV